MFLKKIALKRETQMVLEKKVHTMLISIVHGFQSVFSCNVFLYRNIFWRKRA